MKRSFWLLLAAMLLGGSAMAQLPTGGKTEKRTNLTSKVPVDKKVIIGHLDNGFTYYIRDNRKPEDRIQFRLVSNAGSILERDDQQGLAHFCEHMAFNGIKGYPHNEMIKKLQEHGVEFGRGINAYTGFDQTVYYVDMPASDPEMVKMGIEILDGWAGNILFDPEEIESERGVIHEEWRGGVGHGDRMRKKFLPIVLKGSLYADRMPIGKEEVIMNFKRQSIVDFFNDWYRPDLQAIVVVGDLQNFEYGDKKGAKAMEQRVRDVFGAHAKADNPKPRPVFGIEGNKEPLVAIATDKENASTVLMFAWKHKKAPVGTVGDYRQGLVRSLVSRMFDERFNEICEKASAPMMQAGAEYNGPILSAIVRECDDFCVSGVPKENRIEEAAALFLAEVKRADEHGFLQSELDRQKEDLLTFYTQAAKEADKTLSNSLADEYTNHFLEGEVIPGIRQEWRYAKEFIPEITLEECNKLISSWITDENLVVLLLAPERDGFKVPDEATLLKIVADSKKLKTEPWVDNYQEKPLFTETVAPATAKQTAQNTAVGYTEYTCPNGIKFIVKKTDYKADEIVVASLGLGGTSLYSDQDYYLASETAGLIGASGLSDLTATQLTKRLKGKTVSLSPYIEDECQGFMGSCAPADLETELQLLNLYYSAPRSDKDVFERTTEQLRTQIKLIADNPQVAFMLKYYQTIYPGDKRTILIPSDEQINSLDADHAMKIFRERFHDASNQTFIFVGNVSDKDVDLIARYLKHLPVDGSQKNDKFLVKSPKFAEGIVRDEAVKGIERQGMLNIYGEMNVPAKELTPEVRIAIQAFSNALEMTVLDVVREKNGDAYSPRAMVDFERLPQGEVNWQFQIGCDPDKIAKIEKDCIEILRQYQENGPDEKTLAKAKEQMIVNNGTSRQNNSYWMAEIYGAYLYNESRDYVMRYDDIVRSIDAKQIRDLAQKYINLKNYVAVSLRPENPDAGQAD